jgi:hypothetical protein
VKVFSYNKKLSVQRWVMGAIWLMGMGMGIHGNANAATVKRSIRDWVSCSSTADETSGAIEAFAAARHNAFTLVVDCAVRLHSGLAIDRAIFIDNGTAVQFTAAGKFIVDNLFHPAFVIANSSDIVLTDWNVEWDSSVPVDPDVRGFELGGKFIDQKGITQPAGAFNDIVLSKWLVANRSITFNEERGYVNPVWVGAVNMSAVFYITGSTANVAFVGLKLGVPNAASGDKFLPMAFSLSQNWKSNQTVTGKTPHDAQYLAVPNHLTFSGITLDGTLMGWQGNVQDTLFENITSHRYADLQDAQGKYVGGIDKWFPPPHLFYLNHTLADDPRLYNTNIHFETVNDLGPRLGVARDTGHDGSSGYAASLKLGCSDCSVDRYDSARPDGFMDMLPSEDLTVTNVVATFDSKFINDMYPAALRFPGTGYSRITFENVQLEDTAADTGKGPLGNAPSSTNGAIVFTNFNLSLKQWSGPASTVPVPTIGGTSNNISLDVRITEQSTQVSHLMKGTVSATLKATPIQVRPGAATQLTWTSAGASSCSASGAWAGSIGDRGTRVVKVGTADNYDFGLDCRNFAHASNPRLMVTTR